MEIERREYDALVRTSYSFMLVRNYLESCGNYPDKDTLLYLMGMKRGEQNGKTEVDQG